MLDHDAPTRPAVLGVAFDEDDRVRSDLLCWTCAYNLRSIERDASCPECGTSVEHTLKFRDGRMTRPWSLHTLSTLSRTLGVIFGLLGPALVVIFTAFAPMNPINVEWQSGELRDYIGVMLAGRAMWAFYPFLLWAYIAFGVLMVGPAALGRQWWIKAGLWLGCVLGLQYQLIVCGNLFGLERGFWISILVGLVPLAVLGSTIFAHAARDQVRRPKPRRKRSVPITVAIVAVTFLLLATITIMSSGIALVLFLFVGPYMMLLCMGAALCRLYRTDFAEPDRGSKVIPNALTIGGYLAAWPVAVGQAQIVYSSLPTQPPGCYVCSASAHGHRWLTRATPVRFADGRVLLVTRQMQTLKAAELRLAHRFPTLHRALRSAYDAIGPRIAGRIRSPWLADASYLLFVPVAVIARWLLAILRKTHEIDAAYRPKKILYKV